MKRRILKDAILQIKAARAEAEAAGEEWDEILPQRRSVEYLEDTLDIKNQAVERRRTKRREQQGLRRAAKTARIQKIQEENITSEWYFTSGDLVTVKKSPRSSFGRPPAGTVAMIVDTVDCTDYQGRQVNGATITVMINGNIEDWPASWVKHCE